MSIVTAFPGVSLGGVSFLIFTMTSTIIFSAILSLGQFGDHVLLFPGSTAMMFAVLTDLFLCSLKN